MKTEELKALKDEANTWLRSGLNGFITAGGVFSSIKRLIANNKEFDIYVEENFGAGYLRIVDKLIACHETFGNEQTRVPVVPPSVLFALSWNSSPDEVVNIIENGTSDATGQMIKLHDATISDLNYYKRKISEQRDLLNKKEIELRDRKNEVLSLKKQLQAATKSDDPEEILRLKAIIEKREQELARFKKECTKNSCKDLDRYVRLLDGSLQQSLKSEPANYIIVSSDELTQDQRIRLQKLLSNLSREINEFGNIVGVSI